MVVIAGLGVIGECTVYVIILFYQVEAAILIPFFFSCVYLQPLSCFRLKYYPGQKKKRTIEIRGEKNAVPHVISCSIRRDQRRADRTWSSMISHVEQRSSRRESRGWFFFLSRVVHVGILWQCTAYMFIGISRNYTIMSWALTWPKCAMCASFFFFQLLHCGCCWKKALAVAAHKLSTVDLWSSYVEMKRCSSTRLFTLTATIDSFCLRCLPASQIITHGDLGEFFFSQMINSVG